MRLLSWVAHRTPLLSGLTQVAFNRVTNRVFGGDNYVVRARTTSGFPIDVEINDYHGRILYLFGTNDPKVQGIVESLLEPGDVFADIGANYSTIGFAASRAVGPNGAVHLFEPQPHLAERVQAALRESSARNVTLHRVALMDRSGEMKLRVPPSHSGMATLVQHSDQSGWNEFTIPVVDIAAYVAPLVGERPFGVKLDVEGAEPVLIPWIVAQPRLKFLVFEAAHNHAQLYELITSQGFQIFGLRRNLVRGAVERVDSLADLRGFHDLVATRVESAPKRMSYRQLAARARAVRRTTPN